MPTTTYWHQFEYSKTYLKCVITEVPKCLAASIRYLATSIKCYLAIIISKTPLLSGDHFHLFQSRRSAIVVLQSLLPLALVAGLCWHICFVIVLIGLDEFVVLPVIIDLAVLFNHDCTKCFRLCIYSRV